jgi:DNA-binding PadR family transcriptional regulator
MPRISTEDKSSGGDPAGARHPAGRKTLCSVNRSSSDSETSMAVRDALLTLLTIGPAYGFQLHGGLETRTGGRRRVNVGQTYATLDRLTKQRLIAPAGKTDDGLPLHALTPAGVAAADGWLGGADASGADPWDETVDRVLIALSLPAVDARSIVDAELERWSIRLAEAESAAAAATAEATDAGVAPGPALAAQAARAEAARAGGALDWLRGIDLTQSADYAFAPDTTRPRRGRRPGVAAGTDGTDGTEHDDEQGSSVSEDPGRPSAGNGTPHPSARA